MKKVISSKIEFNEIIRQYLKNDISLSFFHDHYRLNAKQENNLHLLLLNYYARMESILSFLNTNDESLINLDYVFTEPLIEEKNANNDEIVKFMQEKENIKEELKKYDDLPVFASDITIQRLEDGISKLNQDYVKMGKLIDEKKSISNEEYFEYNFRRKYNITTSEYDASVKEYKEYKVLEAKINSRKEEIRLSNKDYAVLKDRLTNLENELIQKTAYYVEFTLNFIKGIHFDMEEAYAFGLEGLVKAINSFDYKTSRGFNTYAFSVIRNHLYYHLKSLIDIDNKHFFGIKKYEDAVNTLKERGINEQDITPQMIFESGLLSDMSLMLIERIKILKEVETRPFSYVSDDELDSLSYEEKFGYLFKYLNKKNNVRYVEDILSLLNQREKEILIAYFIEQKYSLEEIGKIYNISRQRVSQIMLDSFEKIKKYCSTDLCDEYFYKYDQESDDDFYPKWIKKLKHNSIESLLCKILYDELIYEININDLSCDDLIIRYFGNIKDKDILLDKALLLCNAQEIYNKIVKKLDENKGMHNFYLIRDYFNELYELKLPVQFFTFYYHHDDEKKLKKA